MTHSPKRIAILIPDFGGGGAERVALATVNDLLARGQKVDLVLVQRVGALLDMVPAEVNIVSLDSTSFRRALRPLVRYLRQSKPDVIHAFMWPLTIVAVIARRMARSRALLLLNDQVAFGRATMRGSVELALLRATVRIFYPQADVRIACADGAADSLASLSGLRRDQFKVIYNPVVPPDRLETSAEVEALWGDADKRILTIASLKPQKNQALLLRAFAAMKGSDRARLLILGEGPLRADLEALARSLGIADRVAMPGFNIDPWPFLASTNLFVMSSDWEGMPVAMAEALHAGLPIVSTDCPSGPAELLDRGAFGRLVPCGDEKALAEAMAAALADDVDSDAIRQRADRIVGRESIRRYAELVLGAEEAAR